MTIAPLRVIGLGPGDAALLTPQARAAIAASDCIVGYTLYVDLVPEELRHGREVLATGMMAEMARCNAAIDAALAGRATCVVCSGDPGVYAMAGLVFELLDQRGLAHLAHAVEVAPGVPALCGAAALLGAPLMHDFASVSLSDLLTPWPVIERRLDAALGADFVVVIYNPRSRRRADHLEKALAIAARHRGPDTPVGLVRQAYRPDQQVSVTPLAAFDPVAVDMLSIVIIGNGTTTMVGGRMVTPRGYMDKYAPGGRDGTRRKGGGE
ncbi:precorrin-3B C(17)-methyltransferase [Nitratidesulfovibrio termitidis]|uniref:precorrin-3B C(17)-methyltransferase n=1 Tax=Nitratidesulfovibrio termitidis TaxID=42252 RepID=UPI0004044F44|nr:precorrin-3B C(17)-methyltransferase [Nitratidesulfovibrio termitidis]